MADSERSDFEKAKHKAMAALERRMYTKKELEDKIIGYGFDEDTAKTCSDWAQEYGFIDDAEYARVYIRSKRGSYGMKRIRQALLYKGIDRYVIDDVFAEDEYDEKEDLLPLVEKKIGGNFEKKNIDKVIRHFVSKGYSFSDIKAAIGKIKEFEGELYYEDEL